MPGFEFVYRIPIDVGNVHVCVLRNRISFLSTVSRFSRIHRFYISRTFTPSDPSLLLSSNLRPFSFSAVFGKDSCVSLVINKTQRRSRKYLRREKRNRRKKRHLKGEVSYVSVFRYLSSGRQGGDLESGWIINRDLWFDLGAIRLSRWSLLDGRGKPRGRIEDS